MSSTTGSTPPSAEPSAAPPSSRTAGRRRPATRSSGCARSPRGAASSSSAGRGGAKPATHEAERGRPRGRARRRRHDAARAAALPRHRRAGDRRQLRPRRLPHLDAGGRARGGRSRRAFAGEYERRRAADARAWSDGERWSAVNDVVVTSSTLGRMIELGWALGGEDLGTQPCDGADLLDAVGLDRLQPLERRPGARLGARRDGGHVRRAALAARAAAGRPARPRRSRSRNRTADVSATVLVDGHAVARARAGRRGRRPARRSSGACSRRCRRATFFSRYRARSSPSRNRHTIGTIRVTPACASGRYRP